MKIVNHSATSRAAADRPERIVHQELNSDTHTMASSTTAATTAPMPVGQLNVKNLRCQISHLSL